MTLSISVGTIGRPHGLSPSARYHEEGSVILASFCASVNGIEAPVVVVEAHRDGLVDSDRSCPISSWSTM